MSKVVFFQGTFDLLNAGHVRLLEQAKKKGDILIIGLNSDSLVRWYKLRDPILPFKQRREILRAIRWVDQVIECHEPSSIRYLKRLNASVYILGDEWEDKQREAVAYIKEKGGKVVVTPRFSDIFDSSTLRFRVVATYLAEKGEGIAAVTE